MTIWDATPLPRGRHNLAREDVTAAQRARIFTGLTQSVAERGYVNTPVAEILRRAGVSRETFYQLFESKQDCFLECLDQVTQTFLARLGAEIGHAAPPRARFERLLDTYLTTIADDPDRGRVFLVESYAVGPEAIVARTGIQDMFVQAIVSMTSGSDDAAARFRCEAFVAALSTKVTLCLASGAVEEIRELYEPYLALAADMGVTAAS